MTRSKYVSISDKLAEYKENLYSLKKNMQNLSKEDFDKQCSKCIKKIESSNSKSNNYNTNINLFSNDKNCNNVVYSGGYSSSLSRSSTNTVNGITYGPSVF